MDDLIKQLRMASDNLEEVQNYMSSGRGSHKDMFKDAADRIERLECKNSRLLELTKVNNDYIKAMVRRVNALERENAELRESNLK